MDGRERRWYSWVIFLDPAVPRSSSSGLLRIAAVLMAIVTAGEDAAVGVAGARGGVFLGSVSLEAVGNGRALDDLVHKEPFCKALLALVTTWSRVITRHSDPSVFHCCFN
jgi:hypothetical protein